MELYTYILYNGETVFSVTQSHASGDLILRYPLSLSRDPEDNAIVAQPFLQDGLLYIHLNRYSGYNVRTLFDQNNSLYLSLIEKYHEYVLSVDKHSDILPFLFSLLPYTGSNLQ